MVRRFFTACTGIAFMVSGTVAVAAGVVEEIELQGMTTPASPRALQAALEKELPVKVLGYDFYTTASGWPTITLEYDPGAVSRQQIEALIDATEDPAGTAFKVHRGEVKTHLPLSDEEIKADRKFTESTAIEPIENPLPADAKSRAESQARGEKLYVTYCAKCHGLTGGGTGASAHGIATNPRQLWVWHNADKAADPYLYWFITNGRSDMPPWGVILADNQRWDLVNYIKTIQPPK